MFGLNLCPDRVAEAAQYLASGRAQAHPVSLILDVLSRKVLNQGTVHPLLSGKSKTSGFSQMNYGQAEAGVGVLPTRTLRDRTSRMRLQGCTGAVSW